MSDLSEVEGEVQSRPTDTNLPRNSGCMSWQILIHRMYMSGDESLDVVNNQLPLRQRYSSYVEDTYLATASHPASRITILVFLHNMAVDVAERDSNGDARGSLDLLEVRLGRLEFLLTGSSDLDGQPAGPAKPRNNDEAIVGRLHGLQARLERLRKNDDVSGEMIRDIETICKQASTKFSY